jgi:Protein of unknown function (DUF3455)
MNWFQSMNLLTRTSATVATCLGLVCSAGVAVAQAELPEALRTPGETPVLTVYAEGAQVYECKADTAGKLSWSFREPIATLLQDGKTVGRHYAGLGTGRWQHRARQGFGARARGHACRHSMAQARRCIAKGPGPAQRNHHDPARQDQWRRAGRRLRQGRNIPLGGLCDGLHLPEALASCRQRQQLVLRQHGCLLTLELLRGKFLGKAKEQRL